MTQPAGTTEVTLGEVSRAVSRVESEMRDGFATIHAEIKSLSFVPTAVYTADKAAWGDRFERLVQQVNEEHQARRDSEAAAAQRAWQARWGIILALLGMPISIIGAVVAALVIASLK